MDWLNRYEHGEFFSADSIKLNTDDEYHTILGRPVYGGGGIMPDVFVAQDTTGVTSYLIEVSNKRIIQQFCFNYSDTNRAKLNELKDVEKMVKYLRQHNIVDKFLVYADSKGIKRRNLLISKSYKLIERNVLGGIIYNILGQQPYIQFLNQDDNAVLKAMEILKNGDAFPKAPENQS